ncbi:auxin response factor 4-like [Dorcoceras hygrometricum]|uniref:Auxin response factor 4-like n=1 Tax=Dorcoceras hygrometricum TaxID=472368 RepID=A0A2Z7CJE8_9LAMI|nr:auxin response factor 4-like [Dorcoceras hygrometricum]
MESPRKDDWNKSDHSDGGRRAAAQGGAWWCRSKWGGEEEVGGYLEEARVLCYFCDPQWFRDTASRGPTTIVTPKSQFRTYPPDHGKAPSNIAHDPLDIIDSSCKKQLVVVSVQYGPFNTYIPIRSTTIGKSRVARDPITMHTSWRSNSDIASVTRQTHLPKTHPVLWPEIYHTIVSSDNIGYPRMRASGESSTTKHRLLHASGPHLIPPPNDPNSELFRSSLYSSKLFRPSHLIYSALFFLLQLYSIFALLF